jgi:hypothetical protein
VVKFTEGISGHLQKVFEDRLIEVNASEPLNPFRRAQEFEAAVAALQNGRVESASAQVVGGDEAANLKLFSRGVVRSCSHRLSEYDDAC